MKKQVKNLIRNAELLADKFYKIAQVPYSPEQIGQNIQQQEQEVKTQRGLDKNSALSMVAQAVSKRLINLSLGNVDAAAKAKYRQFAQQFINYMHSIKPADISSIVRDAATFYAVWLDFMKKRYVTPNKNILDYGVMPWAQIKAMWDEESRRSGLTNI